MKKGDDQIFQIFLQPLFFLMGRDFDGVTTHQVFRAGHDPAGSRPTHWEPPNT